MLTPGRFQSNMISKGIDVSNLSSPDDTTRVIDILCSCIRDSLSLAVPLVKKWVNLLHSGHII
jgi:hypothetical protein